MAEMRLRAIIDASIDKLKRALGIAKNDIKDFGKSASKAGDDGTQKMKELTGALTGMGSQVAVIAKGFESLKKIITFYLIDPIREAYDMAVKLGKLNTSSSQDIAKTVSEKSKKMAEDFRAYKDFVRSQDGSMASEEKRRQMARDLDTKYFHGEKVMSRLSGGIRGEELDSVIAEQLKTAQQSQLRTAESSLEAMKREQAQLDKILKSPDIDRRYDRTGNAVVDGGLAAGSVIQKVVDGVQVTVDQVKQAAERSQELTRLIAETGMSIGEMRKEGNWGEDYLSMQAAMDADERFKKSLAYEDRIKNFAAGGGGETYGSREEEEEAIRREAKALDRLAETEEQRADVRKAFDKRMAETAEKWDKVQEDEEKALQEAYEKALDEWGKQREATIKAADELAKAQQEYISSVRDLAKTEKDIRDDKRREREDERLAALERKKASYGFSLDGVDLGESALHMRKRLARESLDAGIAEKLSQWESGGSVRFTRKERKRIASAQDTIDEQERIEARQERRERRKTEQSRNEAMANAVGKVISARLAVVNYSRTLVTMEGYLKTLAESAQNTYTVK